MTDLPEPLRALLWPSWEALRASGLEGTDDVAFVLAVDSTEQMETLVHDWGVGAPRSAGSCHEAATRRCGSTGSSNDEFDEATRALEPVDPTSETLAHCPLHEETCRSDGLDPTQALPDNLLDLLTPSSIALKAAGIDSLDDCAFVVAVDPTDVEDSLRQGKPSRRVKESVLVRREDHETRIQHKGVYPSKLPRPPEKDGDDGTLETRDLTWPTESSSDTHPSPKPSCYSSIEHCPSLNCSPISVKSDLTCAMVDLPLLASDSLSLPPVTPEIVRGRRRTMTR